VKTNIRWLNGVSIPRDPEHSVASGFGNEGVCSTFADIGGNDVFDSSVATEPASDAYICVFRLVSRLTNGKDIPCKGVPSVVYIMASQPGSNSTSKV